MNNTTSQLPRLVITGASGFIGRHFIIATCSCYQIFCIARRSQREVGIPRHENITWIQTDISEWEEVQQLIAYIRKSGGADYVLHLAGYYDFSNKDHPAYSKVNIQGTENVLAMADQIGAKRFFFSSSLAGCKFTAPGEVITEETPLLADFPYARSKRAAENRIQNFSSKLPCTIIRLAAIFSDWCEYPPLYILLETWLSRSLVARILGGKGEFAIPYIHIKDLIEFFNLLIAKSDTLPTCAVYIASQPRAVYMKEIYSTATKCYCNQPRTPVFIPRTLAKAGLYFYPFLHSIIGKETFLKPWMGQYIDKQLNVDPSWTFNVLNWQPRYRYSLLRRMLFLIENKVVFSNNWHFRNQILMEQRAAFRKNIQIYQMMSQIREKVVQNVVQEIQSTQNANRFPKYQKMSQDLLRQTMCLIFQLFALSIKNRDRIFLIEYTQPICINRFSEGFHPQELQECILIFSSYLSKTMSKGMDKEIQMTMDNFVALTTQYLVDELEDIYEDYKANPPEDLPKIEGLYSVQNADDLRRLVRRLEQVY